MASIITYVNGAGGSTGAELATIAPLQMSGVIWYVGNAVSGASDSNAGTERTRPLATLQQAVTNAGTGDIIDLLENHAETISSVVTISDAGLSIIGEGAGTSRPSLTNGVAAATNPMISVQAASVMFDNIQFPPSSVNARERSLITGGSGGYSVIKNLTFYCGANDGQRSLNYTSLGRDTLTGTTFVSMSSDAAAGLELNASPGFQADNIVFDGGSFGWDVYALYVSSATTVFRMTNIQLLNGSNVLMPTGTTGVLQVSEQSGDSNIDWTA